VTGVQVGTIVGLTTGAGAGVGAAVEDGNIYWRVKGADTY